MGPNQLPPEILSYILAHLVEPPLVEPGNTPSPDYSPDSVLALCNARLVCRKWNGLGTALIYHTLTLVKVKEAAYRDRWHNLVNLQTARHAARYVIIDAGLSEHHTPDVAFTYAIDRILDMPKLNGLRLQFDAGDDEVFNEASLNNHLTMKAWRMNTIKAVVNAMVSRAAKPDNVPIRSLTIVNLPGRPIPSVTCSGLFKEAVRHVRYLHLHIAHTFETLSHGPDPWNAELRQFEPHLQLQLLPPLAGQLRALTLNFELNWGICSGSFDGRGLLFPNLETLTLGRYIIGNHGQFDWVLAQKSLKALHLDRCCIVSHLRMAESSAEKWGVRTSDWKKWPPFAFKCTSDEVVTFTFSGTWETTFVGIRDKLPNLVDFQFNWEREGTYFRRPDAFVTELSPMRYIRFEETDDLDPWIDADESFGHFDFMWEDDPIPDADLLTDEELEQASTLNPAEDREERDAWAFRDLIKVTWERRRRRF